MKQSRMKLSMIVLLTVVLLMMLAGFAGAEDTVIIDSGYCGGEDNGTNLTWTLDNEGTLIIEGTGNMEDWETADDLYSLRAPWGAYRDDIITVLIHSGVTTIGDHAFQNCRQLNSITIPDGVIEIGDAAFQSCMELTGITLPNSVTIIGDIAFNCCGLTSITIPERVTSMMSAFCNCPNLANVTILEGVVGIDHGAFEGCSKLTSITIPASIDFISSDAFKNCNKLETVVFLGRRPQMFSDTFSKCGSLVSVYICDLRKWCEDGLCSIFPQHNYSCDCKKESPFDSSVHFYYNNEEIEDLVLPEGITQIQCDAFCEIKSLKSITIPNSVTEIGAYAFYGCTGLTSITIPDSVKRIDAYAFACCTGLTGMIIPDSVTFLDLHTFKYCTGLTSVTIPNSVTYIYRHVFENCTGLTSVTIPESVTKLDYGAFKGCSNIEEFTLLNPDCTILRENDSERDATIPHTATIRGYYNSTGQEYAERYDMAFVDLCPTAHANTSEFEQPATCVATGFTTGLYCSDCNRWLTGHETTQTDPNNHINTNTEPELIATCISVGYTAGIYCNDCKKWVQGHNIIALDYSNHVNTENRPEQEATCSESGYTAGIFCNDCKRWISGHQSLGYNWDYHPNQKEYEATPYTCTSDGYTSGIKCEDCGRWLSGHKRVSARHIDEDDDGFCEVCGQQYASVLQSDEPMTISFFDNEIVNLLFTPSETGFYSFSSLEELQEGSVVVTDKDTNEITDKYFENETIQLLWPLQENQTYIIQIRYASQMGDLTVSIAKGETPLGACGENLIWRLDLSGTLTISGNGYMDDYDPFAKTTMAPWQEFADLIQKIVVENGVTSIGNFAFFALENLESFELPASLKTIGTAAFYGSGEEEELIIPAAVSKIGPAAFAAESWKKITVLNPSCEILEIYTYTNSETGETEEEDVGAWTLGFEETTICGYPGSTAQAYAEKYNRTFIALEQPAAVTEIDDATGIAVTYPDNSYMDKITLSVTEEPNAGSYLVERYGKLSAWNIKTLVNGTEVQPAVPVTVSIPVPDGCNESSLAVYHVGDDGTVKKVEPVTVENGLIIFTATSFSIYIVVDESSAYIPGDINGDSILNNKDLTRLMKYLAGEDVAVTEAALDVNGDGSVNSKDLTRLMKYLAGEDVALF